MKILVINSGSSSIKFQIFDMKIVKSILNGIIERIGEKVGHIEFIYNNKKISKEDIVKDHSEGVLLLEKILQENEILKSFDEIKAVGHRVVHGGEYFHESAMINNDVIKKIEELSFLAPLHNPINLLGIKTILKEHPFLKQVAVFDTVFHQTLSKKAYIYALPYEYYKKEKIRRYGFHGISHCFVSKEAAKIIGKDENKTNLITIHLGNGASICAIKNGKSIDTSMGLTPLEGLVMGTRSGDIDPAIIFYLHKKLKLSIDEIDKILNKKSGLKGICGSNDMREIENRAKKGDKQAILAIEIFCYSIKKYIGAYCVAIGKVDAIVFTGGIGEHSSLVREKICDTLEDSLGIIFDNRANQQHKTIINKINSKIKLFVIKTNEELEIAKQTYEIVKKVIP